MSSLLTNIRQEIKMSNKPNIHEILNRPKPADSLEVKIYSNWQQQKQREKYENLTPLWFAAASLVIVALVFVRVDYTPEVVYAAFNDINSEEKHNVRHSINLRQLQNEFNIQVDLESIPIEMSKYCSLNSVLTAHLRVNDKNLGEIDFYLQQDEFERSIWQSKSGKLKTKPWQLLQSKSGVSLLVIYNKNTKQDAIEKFTHELFFS